MRVAARQPLLPELAARAAPERGRARSRASRRRPPRSRTRPCGSRPSGGPGRRRGPARLVELQRSYGAMTRREPYHSTCSARRARPPMVRRPELAFASPRKLPRRATLKGRVVVLDVAFASEASSGGFEKIDAALHRPARPAAGRLGRPPRPRAARASTQGPALRARDEGRARRLPRDGDARARRARPARSTRSSATPTSTASAAPPSGCGAASSPTRAPTTTRARSTRASARRARRARASTAPSARARGTRRSSASSCATWPAASPTLRSGAPSTPRPPSSTRSSS